MVPGSAAGIVACGSHPMKTFGALPVLVFLALAGLLAAPPAWPAEQALTVTARVIGACRFKRPVDHLDLGVIDPFHRSASAGAAVGFDVLCAPGVNPRIFVDDQPIPLDEQRTTVTPAQPLRVAAAGHSLAYELFAYASALGRRPQSGGLNLFNLSLNARLTKATYDDAPPGRYQGTVRLRVEP